MPSANPVRDAARRVNTRYAKLLTAAAKQAPADKRGHEPTDAQMSFGKVLAHLVEVSYAICEGIRQGEGRQRSQA